MGCFSFLCKECGKGILSNSYRGEEVKLFLLRSSKVIEFMEGEYDSYGGVFEQPKGKKKEWVIDWDMVCALMEMEGKNGIAAVHKRCWQGNIPITASEHDPNQGWGEEGEYFIDTDIETEFN